MSEGKILDRRADVGQKMFIGILTAILTTIFLGALGMSIRGIEKNHDLELRVVKLEVFISNQDRLNERLTRLIDRAEKQVYNKEG